MISCVYEHRVKYMIQKYTCKKTFLRKSEEKCTTDKFLQQNLQQRPFRPTKFWKYLYIQSDNWTQDHKYKFKV